MKLRKTKEPTPLKALRRMEGFSSGDIVRAHIKRLFANGGTLYTGYVNITIDKAAIVRDLATLCSRCARKADV